MLTPVAKAAAQAVFDRVAQRRLNEADIDTWTTDEQRDLIRAVVERVEVRRGGRGPERVTIKAKVT